MWKLSWGWSATTGEASFLVWLARMTECGVRNNETAARLARRVSGSFLTRLVAGGSLPTRLGEGGGVGTISNRPGVSVRQSGASYEWNSWTGGVIVPVIT